jgi:hypothetical protein
LEDSDLAVAPVVRLYFENLDEDPELESVLALEKGGVAIAFVFDWKGGAWWEIGRFTDGWRNIGDLDRLVTFRDIVTLGRSELIIRDSGRGTGLSDARLSIYRLRRGELRLVFQTRERARYQVVGLGSPAVTMEQAWLSYPETKPGESPVIVVDRAAVNLRAPSERNAERLLRRAKITCGVYRWEERREEFVVADPLKSRFCDGTPSPLSRGNLRSRGQY